MSHLSPGLMSAYNSLTDKHLAGYFSNTRIRRHLQRAGLITRSGRIVPDKEYRHKLLQRAHQRHVRECLAQAIFHKVLEMERLHQIEIKRKLEEFARRERVHRMKMERSKRYEEDITRILSPCPPKGSRTIWKEHFGPNGEHSESSESSSSSRPNTAPGKMQRPVRLKPIHSNSTTASLRRSLRYKPHKSSQENNHPLNSTMHLKSQRHLTTKEVSPFCLPVINNFVTPVPPVGKKNDRGVKVTPSSTMRGRRLRPTTASSGPGDPPWLRSSVYQSRVRVNMVYFGKTVHLSNDLIDTREEVRVFQQHCGGENLCVYKGRLREGEAFEFISRRHRGFPFSLTFYLNGLQVERLSSCCEFKHRKGSRLGGKHGHFGFSSVEGASPCYKCIIAMGLDKKPTPPPKRVKGDQSREQSATSLKDEPEMEADRTGEGAASYLERETSPTPKMENKNREQSAPVESKVRDDYEEDFEADDEGPVEDTTLQEEKFPSMLSETEKQDQEKDISEDTDEEDDEDKRSSSGSSTSGSDEEESDAEATKHSEDDENENKAEEDYQTEAAAPANEKDKQKSEETAATRVESPSLNTSGVQNSVGSSNGIEISDSSVPTDNENKLSDDPSEDKNVEAPGHELKNGDEQERAKSVQEKLVEAILKVSQCSSEPELSDTSTEEEEGPAHKATEKEKKEQLQTLVEETNCEESVTNEIVGDQKEFAETVEEKDKEPDYADNIQEKLSEIGESEKAAEDEATTEGDKSKEPGETQLSIDGEITAHNDKIEDSFEGSENADIEASHNDEEKVKKGAAEPDSHHNETGERAKSREEDESSVLEPSEENDEVAVADITEEEAAATSETMEIKAESSEEREALSCEEAPETDTGKMQADNEEAQVTDENSSRSPEECGDSTAEKTEVMHVKTSKTQSSDDETQTEAHRKASGTEEEEEDDSQQENCGVRRESVEVDENAETQNLTNSEIKDENKTQEINDKSKFDISIEQNKNPPEGTESEEMPDEEIEDGIKETEKDVKGEVAEGQISWGELESNGDDKGQPGEEGSETNKVLQKKDDEAGISDNVEMEKVEETKTNEECEDMTENSVSEKPEITEELHRRQDADLDTENVEISSKTIADSEKVSESEATDGTEMNESTPDAADANSGERKAEGESEIGEIDAENGESSVAAELECQEDEENAPTAEEERQADEPDEDSECTEVKEIAVESGDNAAKHEEGLTDKAPETGMTESVAKEANGGMVKHDEAPNRESEPEISGAEIQDERNDNEEVEEVDNEIKEFNLIQNNTENDVGKVSPLAETSSAPAAADVEETANQGVEGKLESITDKPLETGDNGEDTEEASKASEEGASVLLKPHAQNTEAEDAVGKEPPETLARDDNTDMVTNWIQMHQISKLFETFVEPLEDIRKEVPDAQVYKPNGEEKESAKLLRPESPTKMGMMSVEENESRDETQIEAQDSRGKDVQHENDPAEGGLQGSEETEEKNVETNEEDDQEDCRGLHVEDKESQKRITTFKTEVEAFSGSLKAESDFENQSSGNTNSGPDFIVKQSATDLSIKTEQSNSLNGQKDTNDTWDKITKDGRQITQVTNFTTSNSADGSQEESHDEDIQTKMLGRRFSGETREIKLIEDIRHTLSKDRLSTLSVFGHASYPLLTTSTSEGGQ
ncbi:glutamate-rich protein 3 [Girardinichthys multiradiatus]|uniref:glutamate-rich protein 3 n=1 Tax=Girardinichthys multiradiatus TaxID=208333 RepID=UPI001FACD4C4|nr:glutamate-rich protein 3 [Girardinichthys multiradiatus]XP_047230808.1 glutamate-rich protein 3 [Girardinichthys multiradiatus]